MHNILLLIVTLFFFLQKPGLLANDYFANIIRNELESFKKANKIPGIAIALCMNEKGYMFSLGMADLDEKKPVTQDTIFEIASITKVFTSTALAVEVLRGRMRLQDPITKFLPGIQRNDIALAQVNLAQLATHTSSLPRVPPSMILNGGRYNPNTLMPFLEKWKPSYPVGTRYAYSNLGFGILGFALENVEQKDYMEILSEFILNPLKMSSTMINVPQNLEANYAQGYTRTGVKAPQYNVTVFPGGGALRSTSSDMLKFLEANMGIEGPKELMKAMQYAQNGLYRVNDHLTMGLGWQRFTTEGGWLIIDKNGGVSGFSSYIGMVPDKKLGIVILMNKGKSQSTEIGRKILTLLYNSLRKTENDIHGKQLQPK